MVVPSTAADTESFADTAGFVFTECVRLSTAQLLQVESDLGPSSARDAEAAREFATRLANECRNENHLLCAVDRYAQNGLCVIGCPKLVLEAMGPICKDPAMNPNIGSHHGNRVNGMESVGVNRPGFSPVPRGHRAWHPEMTALILQRGRDQPQQGALANPSVAIVQGDWGRTSRCYHHVWCPYLLCSSGVLAGRAYLGAVRITSLLEATDRNRTVCICCEPRTDAFSN